MKTIGILGGMSWESTLDYYKFINKYVSDKMGELHSAKILLYSFDFNEIQKLQHQNKWDELGELLNKQAIMLEQGGAELLVIATNTMHKLVNQIEVGLTIPIIHIADVTSQEILLKKNKRVALFGTKFTMQQDFYKKRMETKYNIDVVIPDEKDMDEIHRIIYTELCLGNVKQDSKMIMLDIANKLINQKNIEGVILGCTELPMIIKQEDLDINVYNTTEIHSRYIVEASLQ